MSEFCDSFYDRFVSHRALEWCRARFPTIDITKISVDQRFSIFKFIYQALCTFFELRTMLQLRIIDRTFNIKIVLCGRGHIIMHQICKKVKIITFPGGVRHGSHTFTPKFNIDTSENNGYIHKSQSNVKYLQPIARKYHFFLPM